MGAGRRATSPTAPDRKSKFPVVTCVAVDENYDFPRSELAAMAKNIARLIDDIDRLDINRRNMMDMLQVLRDVTLFYNEAHPELRTAARKPTAEDAERVRDSGNTTPDRPATPEMQKTPAKTKDYKRRTCQSQCVSSHEESHSLKHC